MFNRLGTFHLNIAHTSLKLLLAWLSISLMAASQPFAMGIQQSSPANSREHDLGISLYKQGETKAALKQLAAAVKKNSKDWESWYHLGLARIRDDDLKNARKALEQSAKLRPDLAQVHAAWAYALMLTGKNSDAEREAVRAITLENRNADAHLVLGVIRLRQHRNSDAEVETEAAIKSNPNLADAYLVKSQALLDIYADSMVAAHTVASTPVDLTDEGLNKRRESQRRRREPLGRAAGALETYLKLVGPGTQNDVWREQLETLKVYTRDDSKNDGEQEPRVLTGSELSIKARVLAKPEPQYTEAARSAQVEGMVLLSAVFSADGKVESILVLRSLPYGLTEQAIAAAKKIKFTPGIKNGRPVSMFMLLQYNFNLY